MKTSMDTWYNHWTSTLRTSLQIISFKLERSGSSLEGKEAKKQTIPSKDETRQYGSAWVFSGWVAFPKQPLVSHCSTANKAAAEGDLLLQWSWLHTLSNLHNLPHNLNQLKCTPGDYFQKPIWKNIHCLTPKKTRGKEAKWQRLQLMRRKKRSKRSSRNKDLAFTFLSIFLRISLW